MKKLKKLFKKKVYLWKLLVIVIVFLGVLGFGLFQGLKMNPKTGNESQNQQTSTYATIKKLEKVNELVLLNTRIQKIKTVTNSTKIFGQKVLASEKKAVIILNYNAKFGIKENVKIEKKGDHQYEVTIPKYQVIGVELDKKKPYEKYHENKEILSNLTPDVDTGEAATKGLTNNDQEGYLDSMTDSLNQSAENYYTGLIQAVDSEAEVTFKNLNK